MWHSLSPQQRNGFQALADASIASMPNIELITVTDEDLAAVALPHF